MASHLRRALNENIGLIGLIFILAAFMMVESALKCLHLEDSQLNCTVIMVVLVLAGGCSFTALTLAIFRRRY